MRLSKQVLVVATLIPIIISGIILSNFLIAIGKLWELRQSTYIIYNELVVMGVFGFLGFIAFWSVMMYLIYLLQENLILVDANLDRAAKIGAKQLQESKGLLNQVLVLLKKFEEPK